MTLAQLMVVLGLNSASFQSGMASAISQVQMLQAQMGRLSGSNLLSAGRALTMGLTLPLAAAGLAIGVFGSRLDAEMARVQSVIATPFDDGMASVLRWRDGVQQIGIDMGRSSTEVAGGLYEIVSAIGPVNNAMEYLAIASKAAVAGQSDIVTSTKNLVLATRAWGDNSTEAVQRMADMAAQTVKVGTLTESELGPALAGALPIARLYGVSLDTVFASLSALSGVTGTASNVSTQFQRAVTSLVAPNTTLAKAYKAMGIASGEALIANKGLVGALQTVMEYSEKSGVPLQKLMGRIEAVKFAATLTGPQLKTFNDHLAALKNSAGAVDLAFAGTTQGINSAAFQWAQAGQRLRVVAEDLYQSFAPVSLKILDSLQPLFTGLRGLADTVAGMDTGKVTAIVYTLLGLAALGPVVSIIGSLATTLSAFGTVLSFIGGLAGPILLLAAAGLALWFAWNNDWGGIQGRTAAAWDALRASAGPLSEELSKLKQAFADLSTAVAAADTGGSLRGLVDVYQGAVNTVAEAVNAIINAIARFAGIDVSGINRAKDALKDLFNTVMEGDVSGALNKISEGIRGLDSAFGSSFGRLAAQGAQNLADFKKGIDDFGSSLDNFKQKAMDYIAALGMISSLGPANIAGMAAAMVLPEFSVPDNSLSGYLKGQKGQNPLMAALGRYQQDQLMAEYQKMYGATSSATSSTFTNAMKGAKLKDAVSYFFSDFTTAYQTELNRSMQQIGPMTQHQFQVQFQNAQLGQVIRPIIGPQLQQSVQVSDFQAAASAWSGGLASATQTADWSQVGTSVGAALTNTLATVGESGALPTDAIVSALQTQIGQALASDQVASSIGPAIQTGLTTALQTVDFSSIKQPILDQINTLGTDIQNAIQGIDLAGAFTQMMTGAQTAVLNGVTVMVTAVQLIPTAFSSAMAAAAGAFQSIVGAAQSAAAGVKAAFNPGQFASIGGAIGQAIAGGLRSSIPAITAAAQAAAAAALSAAKSALQISSPSKRAFNEVGIPFAQGVASGILQGMPFVQRAAGGVWNNMTAGGQYGSGYALAGAGGGTQSTTENVYNIYVTAGPGATKEDGENVGIGITKALRARGML